ncbi:hypothetical protein BAUCODRAFT_411250 [Baudoinia panamericana UAMH 10762]|uniref:Uncharacterized protein n=1 Tax=Baudoinia panamericana (strain UAMH 10762) TaxID=717646 RepID=M2LU35_BAUPA|nr:uncharacterized protein BAUCODRAFT_411250 [Baudoinia panamericana UAMH 10762]EMC98042.1 hypothetical protein BAUCODRAFT_411250 [Baudoinia panamericana UAMH 10762]
MADPLSLTASIIAVGTLAAQVGKKLRAFYHGTNEIFAAQNELTDLEALLRSCEDIQEQPWRADQRGLAERAAVLLGKIKLELQSLSNMLQPAESRWAFVRTKGWAWLKNEKAINQARSKVRALKQTLMETFQLLTVDTSRRAVYQIDELKLQIGDVQTSVVSSRTAVLDEINDMRQLAALIPAGQSPEKMDDGLPSYAVKPPATASSSTVGLECSIRRMSTGCLPLCSCRCHKYGRLSTPRFLDQVVGQLLIGYTMRPRTAVHCDEKRCMGNDRTTFRLLYVFPAWFLSWAIAVLITATANRPPEMLLRIPRLRNHRDALWEEVSFGNIDFVKDAFQRGTAHIDDVTSNGAQSLLHIALFEKRAEMAAFLVDQGADIYLADRKHHTAADIMGLITFSKGMPGDSCSALARRFENCSSFIEKAQFPLLHKIIFGQVDADLEEVLKASTADIDKPDAYGRTALSWCGSRGDTKSGRILLRYGADPNIVEKGDALLLGDSAVHCHR